MRGEWRLGSRSRRSGSWQVDGIAQPREEPKQAFRGAAGQVASGVAIVVTMIDEAPHAATASSGVIASIDPPLLAVFFSIGTRMHECLMQSGSFTANLLGQSDHGLARRFANPARPSGWAGFAGVDLLRRDLAPPILAHAAAWFDCRVRQVVEMGDHACFVGEVIDCGRDPDAPPLLYYRGRFHSLGPQAAPAPWSPLDRVDLVADW
jgi:flavin reductase (DIM6/NTAB) family NADH-FMN oxidoreductase RutF